MRNIDCLYEMGYHCVIVTMYITAE